MPWLVLAIIVTLTASFFCSLFEAIVLSTTVAEIEGLKKTHARRGQLHIGGENLSQPSNFQRRADQAAETGLGRQRRQSLHLMAHVRDHADLGEFVAVEARQDRHTQHQRRRASEFLRGLLRGPLRGAHHLAASTRVDRQHLHVELHRCRHCFGDGAGNIVKFQVEENGRAGGPNASHDVRPGADEQFLADLERAHNWRELFHQFERHFRLRDIQRNDNWIVHDARIKTRTARGWNTFQSLSIGAHEALPEIRNPTAECRKNDEARSSNRGHANDIRISGFVRYSDFVTRQFPPPLDAASVVVRF